jgi:hypothetical protein
MRKAKNMDERKTPKNIRIAFSATAAITALVAAANIYIKKRAKKKKGYGFVLGFDWGYIDEARGFKRLKRFASEIRSGTQRFIKGYDSYIFRDFCDYLDMLIMEDLRYMINHRHGTIDYDDGGNPSNSNSVRYPYTDDDFRKDSDKFTADLKEMLHRFEQSRNDSLSERQQNEHHRKALEMLVKYYDCLWD